MSQGVGVSNQFCFEQTNQIFVWTYGLTSLGEKIRGVYMQDLG